MWRCIYTYVQLYLKYICIIHVCVWNMYLHTIPLFYTYVCFSYIVYYIYIYACVCVNSWLCAPVIPMFVACNKKTTVLVHILGLSENKVLKPMDSHHLPHFKVLILRYFGYTQFQDQLVSLLIRPNSQLTYRTSACLVKVAAPAKITSKSRRGWLKDPNIPGESHPMMTVFCD